MHWLAKAASLKILSAIPGGAWLYRLGQEKLTGSLEPTPSRVEQKLEVGIKYYNWLETRGEARLLLEGTHLDFGAGWHPTIPLLYFSIGASRQVLCDLRPLLSAEMVAQTVDIFRSVVSERDWKYRSKLRRLPESGELPTGGLSAWLNCMGMSYLAPCEAQLGRQACSIDVVTCTQVLYYVPRVLLADCLAQIWSVLKPGGRFLATIRLTTPDLGGLSDYGHLRRSPETWERWFNSCLLSYNLFKPPDYRQALQDVGFEVLHFEVNQPTPQDWADLGKVSKHHYFDRYKPADLVGKHLFLVAGK